MEAIDGHSVLSVLRAAWRAAARDCDFCRPEATGSYGVARFSHDRDGAVGNTGVFRFEHGLVKVGIKCLAGGIELGDAVLFQRAQQFLFGQFDAFYQWPERPLVRPISSGMLLIARER